LVQSAASAPWPVEIIVVDNGSRDRTREVIRTFTGSRVPVRAVVETRKGLSAARNRAVREAVGTVIVFTDDDLRHPSGWVQAMAAPILTGEVDAVVGRVVLAEHLQRPWLTRTLRYLFAETQDLGSAQPDLIGASMAVSRQAAAAVAFEEELGAGRLGAGEDVLFSLQLKEAGFRIGTQEASVSVHHFDPARLERRSILAQVEGVARSEAWIRYHWLHGAPSAARAKAVISSALIRGVGVASRLGLTLPLESQIRLVKVHSYNQQMMRERTRERAYEPRGTSRRSTSAAETMVR
jgi:GT2 family glycosyltransferase